MQLFRFSGKYMYWVIPCYFVTELKRVTRYRISWGISHKTKFILFGDRVSWWSLVPAKAGKLTIGLASHWPCVTDNSGITTYGLMALGRETSSFSAPRLNSSRSMAHFTFISHKKCLASRHSFGVLLLQLESCICFSELRCWRFCLSSASTFPSNEQAAVCGVQWGQCYPGNTMLKMLMT